ncbi:nucleolar protein dao-5-like [Ixodes scapularis]|uniref:nucleolar protein dao-5-like n=1 Tax=Ixodes scapularis TaxID=6945 RepID=UPI001A9D29B7|nr:nucleolar protein dao-5-like [Ixodes scapularis]
MGTLATRVQERNRAAGLRVRAARARGKARELEALCRAATGVEGVTEKACQGKEKVGADDTELTGDQRLSPDTTVAVLRKPDPNSERRNGESDVEAAAEVVCQEKRKTEAGDTEVTGNQRVSSDTTDAVPRKTNRTPERREKEEKALRASSCDFPEDEGDAKTETTPGESSQLMESGAEMPQTAVQQTSQDPDRSDRHPCGFGIQPTAPSQESTRLTRREVIGISFDEINHTCLVRLRSPDSRPFTESASQENVDEHTSGSESSRLEDGRPQAGHNKEPATGGGCAGKGPTGDTMEPGRDKASPTPVHLRRSSSSRHGASETENSEAVMSKQPRPKRKRRRRISVVRSSSKASCKERPGRRDERHLKKRKRSSKLGGGKLQHPNPNKPRTHSSSARKEPGGGNNEPGTTQRGSKRRHSSSPVVQPGITSDGETKGDLRDCSFAPARKSKEKNLNSPSDAKNKHGVG